MNYRIVENRFAYDLAQSVERYIKQGWEPLGGVAVAVVPEGIMGPIVMYYQAVVRK